MVGRCRCCHHKSPRALHRHGVRYRAAVRQEPASASPRTNQHLTPGPPWDSGESGVRTPQSDAQPVNTYHANVCCAVALLTGLGSHIVAGKSLEKLCWTESVALLFTKSGLQQLMKINSLCNKRFRSNRF